MKNQSNQESGIFDLLNEWTLKLPKNDNEIAESSMSTLSQIGKEIKQRCTDLNQSSTSPSSEIQSSRPVATKPNSQLVNKPPTKPETKPNTENTSVVKEGKNVNEKFKPPFIFELKADNESDTTSNFTCVYDFCIRLEEYCKAQKLDIEEHWYQLLQTCSSHNYDRFMWILSTFQHATKLRITWKQVVRRLMSKYDDPDRRFEIETTISNLKHLLAMNPGEHIFTVNNEFARYADELGEEESKLIEMYMNGLPQDIRGVVRSTMKFDESTDFRYTLPDVQQRAAMCISADKGSYVFYSKSAHLATSLDVDKVSTSTCEFHIIGDHSTTSCPDYSIIKYPYMDFIPAIVTATLNVTLSLPAPESQENRVSIPSSNGNSSNNTEMLVAKEEVMEVDPPKITNVVLEQPKPTPKLTLTNNQKQAPPPQKSPVKAQFARTMQKPQNAKNNNLSVNTSSPVVKNHQTTNTITSNAKLSSPVTPSEGRKEVSVQRVQITPSGLTAIRSVNKYELTNDNDIPNESSSSKRLRSESPEVGCYIHGKNSNHTTRQCYQANMVIPPRNTNARNPNNCAFCGIPFFPGHLNQCTSVPAKYKKQKKF